MNFGLVGWGIASGNGGMNTDIATLAPWVTHWLIPSHPDGKNHQPYLERAKNHAEVIECNLKKDHDKYNYFLSKVDAIIYIEHPVLRDQNDFDIVSVAKKLGKLVVGIPMWEWWPERSAWALKTDVLISVTQYTTRYLNSLSDVLYVHGTNHNWRNNVIDTRWGVNLDDFKFRERKKIERIVFVNGNGGYKLRKASDLVFQTFSKSGAPPLTVMSQRKNIADFNVGKNIHLIENNFPNREDVYQEGDLFLFPSYWEGLCHGLYEAQACGGFVVTTDHPPMNECGTKFLLPVKSMMQEDLSGKKILKTAVDPDHLFDVCSKLYGAQVSGSIEARARIEKVYDLRNNLLSMYRSILAAIR